MIRAFRQHWPEYLMEGACLCLFMISAGVFTSLLEHPASPLRRWIPGSAGRLALNGLAMGFTAIGLIYSPWGARSGAHMNPAVTWAFFRLGRVRPWDAVFYPLFQTLGGIAGVWVVARILGRVFTEAPVNWVVTVPGRAGVGAAFLAEGALAFGMMLTVLVVTGRPGLQRFAGVFGGVLVCLYITFEAPLSGMSINPARTLASAFPSGIWTGAWIYLLAPVAGMLLAAEIHGRLRNPPRPACPKWNHDPRQRCIFCGHPGGGPPRNEDTSPGGVTS